MKYIEKLKTIVLAILIFLVLIGLFGCASQPSIPTEVKIPTPISCIAPGSIPDAPALESLQDDAKTLDGDLMLHLARDMAALKMYSDKLRVIAEGCSRI